MVFDITQIKKIRRSLNLTQNQFAKQAGVSQSMIAKIESGKLDPTYSHVKKIEETIENISKKEETKAKNIMNKKVITVGKNTKLKRVINLMTKSDISQVPVTEKGKIVGLITESDLLELNEQEIAQKTSEEIMKESPPIISENANTSIVLQLLKFYPLLIIKEFGKLKGVITKSDILKSISK